MRYIICYTVCEARKNPSTAAKGKLGQYLVDEPLERVAIHTLSLLPRTEKGSTYIVIISDYLKRLIVSYSISKQEAITMAGFLWKHLSQVTQRSWQAIRVHVIFRFMHDNVNREER